MARLTPNEILKLSEPVEQVYSNIVDALLINMGKHFNSGHSLSTEQWEIRKLAELGQLNKESIEIIASLTGQNKELITAALENAVYMATKDIEPELKKAVQKGAIQNAAADNVIASQSIVQALNAYEQQAMDKLNLVNTTMLESTLAQYRKVITNTVNIERQMKAAQEVLNIATGKVITGTESRQQALRQALSQIHKEGITGFYDRIGRKWSPEAYVNMDIRTTVHNTAIEAVKIRQEDYGVDIFRVSRHSGARPLCYPYQGRYFSWNNKSGTFTDGEGKRHRYSPISSTSYGKPAGLFGINCGHHPITMIPGVSIPRDRPEQDKEENDKVYAESQEQRRLEREIRYSKQKAAMMEAAGDKEGFEKEAVKIREKQADYNAFCKKTGRTKRLDRTQVFDYNKSISGKVTSINRKRDKNIFAVKSGSYQNDISSSGLPKVIKLPNETLKQTANVNLPNIHAVVPKGTELSSVVAIAGAFLLNRSSDLGAGTSSPIKDIQRLVSKYPSFGDANGWQKKSGVTITDNFRYEIHWYENTGGVPSGEVKVKGVKRA